MATSKKTLQLETAADAERLSECGILDVEMIHYSSGAPGHTGNCSAGGTGQVRLNRGFIYRDPETAALVSFVSHDKVAYKLGDCVYVDSQRPDKPYYVAAIQSFKMTKKDQLNVLVKWYYRPCELPELLYDSLLQERISEEHYVPPDDAQSALREKRELFISDAIDTYPVSALRGKSYVHHYKETSLVREFDPQPDHFYYILGYNPETNRLASIQGEIRVGQSYQVKVPDVCISTAGSGATTACQSQLSSPTKTAVGAIAASGSASTLKEVLLWIPDRISDGDLIMYLQAARSMAAFAGMCDSGSTDDMCVAAARDQTTVNALNALHRNNYDTGKALQELVKSPLPLSIEKRWCEEETKKFVRGLKQFGKNFFRIQKDLLPHKKTTDLVHFYYLWKKYPTAHHQRPRPRHRRVQSSVFRRSKASGANNSRVSASSSNRPTWSSKFLDLSSASDNDSESADESSSASGPSAARSVASSVRETSLSSSTAAAAAAAATTTTTAVTSTITNGTSSNGYACHHCYTTSSKNWHHAGKHRILLCADCRVYFKKYGELRPVDRPRTPPAVLFKPIKDDSDDLSVYHHPGIRTRRSGKDAVGNACSSKRRPVTPSTEALSEKTNTVSGRSRNGAVNYSSDKHAPKSPDSASSSSSSTVGSVEVDKKTFIRGKGKRRRADKEPSTNRNSASPTLQTAPVAVVDLCSAGKKQPKKSATTETNNAAAAAAAIILNNNSASKFELNGGGGQEVDNDGEDSNEYNEEENADDETGSAPVSKLLKTADASIDESIACVVRESLNSGKSSEAVGSQSSSRQLLLVKEDLESKCSVVENGSTLVQCTEETTTSDDVAAAASCLVRIAKRSALAVAAAAAAAAGSDGSGGNQEPLCTDFLSGLLKTIATTTTTITTTTHTSSFADDKTAGVVTSSLSSPPVPTTDIVGNDLLPIPTPPPTTTVQNGVPVPLVSATCSVIKQNVKVKKEEMCYGSVDGLGSFHADEAILPAAKEPAPKIDDNTEFHRSKNAVFRRHWNRGWMNSCARTDLVYVTPPGSPLAKRRLRETHAPSKKQQLLQEMSKDDVKREDRPSSTLNKMSFAAATTTTAATATTTGCTMTSFKSSPTPSLLSNFSPLTAAVGGGGGGVLPSGFFGAAAVQQQDLPALQRLKEYATAAAANTYTPGTSAFYQAALHDPMLQHRILNGFYGPVERERLEHELRERQTATDLLKRDFELASKPQLLSLSSSSSSTAGLGGGSGGGHGSAMGLNLIGISPMAAAAAAAAAAGLSSSADSRLNNTFPGQYSPVASGPTVASNYSPAAAPSSAAAGANGPPQPQPQQGPPGGTSAGLPFGVDQATLERMHADRLVAERMQLERLAALYPTNPLLRLEIDRLSAALTALATQHHTHSHTHSHTHLHIHPSSATTSTQESTTTSSSSMAPSQPQLWPPPMPHCGLAAPSGSSAAAAGGAGSAVAAEQLLHQYPALFRPTMFPTAAASLACLEGAAAAAAAAAGGGGGNSGGAHCGGFSPAALMAAAAAAGLPSIGPPGFNLPAGAVLDPLAIERLQQIQQEHLQRQMMIERERLMTAQHQVAMQHNEMMRRLQQEGSLLSAAAAAAAAAAGHTGGVGNLLRPAPSPFDKQ